MQLLQYINQQITDFLQKLTSSFDQQDQQQMRYQHIPVQQRVKRPADEGSVKPIHRP